MVTGGNQAPAAAAAAAAAAVNAYSQDAYYQYYQNWSQYAAWNQYSQQYPDYSGYPQNGKEGETNYGHYPDGYGGQNEESNNEGDEFELIEHSSSLDVDATNKKFLARTEELWDSIETSGWWLEDKHE